MIGMIALAGIIVRNSILLVDFMNHTLSAGSTLEQAVISAAAVRAKPIVLTALAAMMGGFFILDDPIFNGLAVSLIFGLLVSTVLTLVVIPSCCITVCCDGSDECPVIVERLQKIAFGWLFGLTPRCARSKSGFYASQVTNHVIETRGLSE